MKPPVPSDSRRVHPGHKLNALTPKVSGKARADKNLIAERARERGAVHPKNKLNALTGEQWLYRSKSVLQTAYPSAYGHKLRKRHGANKPPQLMRDLIEFFTKPGERVLDPFAGVGGTLIGASLCGRSALGIEINPEWTAVYGKVCVEEEIAPQEVIAGDCLEVLPRLEAGSADFLATDPPYNLHFERTMCTGEYDRQNRKTDYDRFSRMPADFSNSADYGEFLDRMERMFAESLRVLRPGAYAAVILRNAYQDGEYMMTQADVAARARLPVLREGKREFRFFLKGEIIWHQAGSRLRPYGYPYAFVPNIAHQTIVILRKEAVKAARRSRAKRGPTKSNVTSRPKIGEQR